MTLSELASKTGRSLSSIVDFAVGSKTSAPRSSAPAKPSNGAAPAKRGRAKGVDTRTASGREAYDSAIQAVIEAAKGPLGATQLRAKVGGTPQQARAALHRLIEAGTITYTGQARATRYMPS